MLPCTHNRGLKQTKLLLYFTALKPIIYFLRINSTAYTCRIIIKARYLLSVNFYIFVLTSTKSDF